MCNSAAKQVSAGVSACNITGRTSFGNVVVGKCFVLARACTKKKKKAGYTVLHGFYTVVICIAIDSLKSGL